MKSETIQKYKNKTIKQLKKKLKDTLHFYIKLRDTNENGWGACISCRKAYKWEGKNANYHAGHFYPAGSYSSMKYLSDNIHGQCKSCNYFKGANLHEYRKNLVKKIGKLAVEKLDYLSDQDKKHGGKFDMFYYIEQIENYKSLGEALQKQKNW